MTETFKNKTIWIIGASEGLGKSLAEQLAANGAQCILSARNQIKLEEVAQHIPNSTIAPLDVTDPISIQNAFDQIGPVDGIVYNAGAYDPMAATCWDAPAVERMTDVNYLGALRVIGLVLPGFLHRQAGEITLIGSLAGYRGLTKSIGYGASKAALISLAETMRCDLAGSGVVVRLINPGFIKTRLTEKNDFYMPMQMTPEAAAAKVVKAMGRTKFRTDFPAPFSWFIRSLSYIPDILYFRGR